MVVSIAALSGIVAMFESFQPSDYFPQGPGGWLGSFIFQKILRDTMGVLGAGLLLGTLYLSGLLFIFTKDIGAEFDRYISAFQAWRENRARLKAEKAEAKAVAKAALAKEKAVAKNAVLVAKQNAT